LRQVAAPVERWQDGQRQPVRDELAAEEPLEIRVRSGETAAPETLAVILRTPGHDEELVAGFLYGEGFLRDARELRAIEPGVDADGLPSDNIREVVPTPGVDLAGRIQAEGYSRKFAVNSSCGICGKNTVAAACTAFSRIAADGFAITPEVLYSLPAQLEAEQRVFLSTGGLHGAALFDAAGALLALREDIGRHNAVDKLIGRALLHDALPLRERVLLVSGRLSFEIVLKALAAHIPVVAAVSAPSSLAVELAEAGGITLVGFLRGRSLNVYTHPRRVRSE
jgi:FdhD protein